MEDVLRASAVTKEYGAGDAAVRAVDDVSLALRRSDVTLIMGPSGSGKTTLLFMLGGLLRPSAGHVWTAGHDLASLPERHLPRLRLANFGFVFQDFNLLGNLTARENVQIPAELAGVRPEVARERATRLLRALGLDDRLDHLPEHLSGGEKQRVAIARSLVNRPRVVFADEPTANLDSRLGRAVAALFRRLARRLGTSVLMVSHDSRIVEAADRVLLMEDGRVSAMS